MAAVHFCTHGAVTQIGMHGIGKVDRGRTLWQLVQRAFWREGEDAILIHRHSSVFEKLFRILAGFEDFDKIAEPSRLPVGRVILLIGPMRGEAIFGGAVHFLTADLDFDPHVLCKHDGGVD